MNHRMTYRNMASAVRQVAIAAGLVLLASVPAWSQASQIPNAKQQFIGPTGAAYDSGQVFMYVPNTFTKKSTWTGPDQSTQNVNPIILDSAGRAKIWGVGSYRQVLKDKNGLQVWDELTIAPPTASTAASSGAGDFLPIGAILPIAGYTAPTNYVLAFGQAVSRATYTDALAALTISSLANCINGNGTITGIASTAQMRVGAPIEASCLSAGTTIATIAGPTSVTVTPVAAVTTATTVRVFNWGAGDGITTFNVPDLRGRVLPGADAMGGTAATRLISTYYGVSASSPGAASTLPAAQNGSNTLVMGNLPASPPSGTIDQITPAGTVNITGATLGGNNTFNVDAGGTPGLVTASAIAATFTGTPFTPVFHGTNLGSSTPFSIVQPSMTVNYAVKMLNGTLPTIGVLSFGGMAGDIACGAGIVCTGNTVSVSGLGTMAFQNSDNVSITGGAIACVNTPVAGTDCANKTYVDSIASGLIFLPPSRLATAAVLPNTPTYANGASGVGATLTAGTNSTLTVDGTVAALNNIVLVKNQASQFQNGQYYVSTAGSGAAAWVLTRCTLAACGKEFDSAATMLAGSLTTVTAGATNIGNRYLLQNTVTTVGTTAVIWNLYDSTFPTVNTVATNALLKALPGGSSVAVIRTGYVTANDVPTAAYYWDGASSCTDDGGSCIQPNAGSGRWILTKPQGPVNAGIFGALCNNTGDDQPKLQAALNYAQSLYPAGGTLRIGGQCVLGAALVATSNVTIEGDAMDSTFLFPNSTSFPCVNLNPANPNRTVNIYNLTCSYASLTSSGVAGIQYGNALFNNIGGRIEWVNCTNCSTGIYLLNAINTVVSHVTISPFYFGGIIVDNPLLPDSGGNVIHDSYIQVFAPLSPGTVGVQWFSGGAFDLHDSQIFAPNPVVLHAQLQTSELHVHHNLLVGTGTVTAGIQVNAVSAAFNCSQATTNLTVSSVTGTLVVSNPGFSLGQTAFCNGTAVGTIVSQTSGTPGGAGVYVTTGSAATSGTGTSTFIMTELVIDGNILDNTVRPIYVPQNIGGEFNYNMIIANNGLSSDSNSATNQVTIYNTSGYVLSGNVVKCNGNCAGGRAVFVDASSSKGTVWHPRSSNVGSWGAADIISSTNTCGMTGNAILTTC